MFTLTLLFLAGCSPVETPDGVDSDTVTPTETDTDVDSDTGADTDTGEEVVGGNCGGPEPPEDSLWECGAGGYGYTWPTAGGPADLEQCLTIDGWHYEISEDGNSVTLENLGDGRVLTCELDE